MTQPRFSLHRTLLLALQQIALSFLVLLLIAVWLHIPDANALEVLLTLVLALVIAAITGAGLSAISLRLTSRQISTRRLLSGTGAVLLAALLWYAVSLALHHQGASDELRAGYLNSRLPSSLRNVLSYEHLVLCFGWLWSSLRWLAAGILAAAAFACVTCDAPLRGLLSIVRNKHYWVCLLLLIGVGALLSKTLLTWTPGHGLRTQLLSLVLRLLVVIVANTTAIALLLQAMASAGCGLHAGGTGEPAATHPRTADMP